MFSLDGNYSLQILKSKGHAQVRCGDTKVRALLPKFLKNECLKKLFRNSFIVILCHYLGQSRLSLKNKHV